MYRRALVGPAGLPKGKDIPGSGCNGGTIKVHETVGWVGFGQDPCVLF